MKSLAHGEPAHLLLVEDCTSDALLVREALADWPVRTRLHVVEDAADAMDFLHQNPPHAHVPRPDVILLDLNMPWKNGHQLLAEIKEDERFSSIPVIIFTTSEAELDIVAAYRGQANCYVTKPRDFHAFSHAVRSIAAFWLKTVSSLARTTL
jgi:CheY-like chemotaxis protein